LSNAPKNQKTHFFFILLCAFISLKESVYKAMHPILCHYVGFHEAEITPLMDGTAKVSLQLVNNGPNNNNNSMDIVIIHSASWKKIGNDFFLTSASVGTTAAH
jgi:4'-phosphopantetheinyl transferase EntD